KLFKTPSLDELSSFEIDLFSDLEEHSEEEVAGPMTETMEEYMCKTRGAIPTKTTANAKIAIQEMVEYSQKWHTGTSKTRSTKTFNGLATIQSQLNNLGREIKKVNEKVYAVQVGCELCKGPYHTKDCTLKKEGETLEEAYYTHFGVPFPQRGQYRAIAPGFYQRNNENPLNQERRQSMEESLSKFMTESAKIHDENSILIKEIQASQMLLLETKEP
nr:hypothetical protein [Tanacetum cinerariifolium]